MADPSGLDALRALGARSVPVVSKGTEYVFAQVIRDVVTFLGLDDDTAPTLSPTQLAERYQGILLTAERLARQMPDERLGDELPNRPRSWRVLMHHIFQIPVAFLDMETMGETLVYEKLTAAPPDDMTTSAAIADFGASVRERFSDWWSQAAGQDFAQDVPTYFGNTSRHEMLERTVWHSTQHTRQLTALLEQAGITPDGPVTAADIQGLPLTDKIWD
jgi:uncharacterized damage-inducible protein DinB